MFEQITFHSSTPQNRKLNSGKIAENISVLNGIKFGALKIEFIYRKKIYPYLEVHGIITVRTEPKETKMKGE